MMNIMFKLIKSERKTNMMQNLKWWTWKSDDGVKQTTKKKSQLDSQMKSSAEWTSVFADNSMLI